MKSLHDKIMNIPNSSRYEWHFEMIAYKEGHRDARHAAAELAVKYDAIIEELVDSLEGMLSEFNESISGIVHDELAAIAKARAALRKAKYGELEIQKARGKRNEQE